MKIDWSRTRAVPWGQYAQVRANIAGRDPEGAASPAEMEDLMARIRELLEGITDPETGERVYARVCRNSEVYEGPFSSLGPDLIAVPEDERYLSVTARSGLGSLPAQAWDAVVTRLEQPVGTHSATGILMLAGPSVETGVPFATASLADIVPTVLCMLDQAVPTDMDGEPLLQVMKRPTGGDDGLRHCDPWPAPGPVSGDVDYTEEDREQVEERLRQLGYL